MQIKRLRIAGFKSFVDPADLRIEPGLTGVVGPNGCGKSNLLEALRWTMGEGSAKSLRGAGMEDVIFAGTATRPPRDFAEVSILAEVEGDETEVVRRIERGAGSAYRVDGRDVRAKDVALLFADAATGAHSPALVSQGRIGAVIAAKPADRRAMLEEAAGIAGLHVRRRDAEQRLRAAEANLERLDTIITDQQARAAALRRQARAAERYRQISQAIRLAEARMIFSRWREAAQAADAAKAEAAAAETRVALAAEEQRAAAAWQHRAAETLSQARLAALAARDEASEAGHRLATLRQERTEVERRLADLADQQRRIGEDRAREGALAQDAAQALARLSDEARTLEDSAATASAGIGALDATLTSAERAARDAEVALAQSLAAQAREAAETRVAAAALTAARSRLDRAEREVEAATRAMAALGEPAPLIAERDDAAADRARHAEAGDAARRALADAETKEADAIIARARAETVRAGSRAELAAIDGEIAALSRALQQATGDRLIDAVEAAPGYERALAAGLGDELEGAAARWRGAEPLPDDPPAPPGTIPLSDHARAPATLARRLAQIFVGDDVGQALAVGQRLVTLAGALRRWDGYVASGTGAAAAERLERRNRLTMLETARPPAAATLADAERNHGDASGAIEMARRSATAARAAMQAADTAIRDATRTEDRATTMLERLAGQRADLDQRLSHARAEREVAMRERDVAAEAVAALPDGIASAAVVAALQERADDARLAVAAARAARQTMDREIAATRERLAATQAEAKGWRSRAGEAAKRIAAMDGREAALAAEAATFAGRPQALDAEIATTDARHLRARETATGAAAAESAAEAALRDTEETHRRANDALADAREARAGALARVENQELRRVEMGRLSGERFECPAPVLPERLDFAPVDVRSPAEESAAHERLTIERERIGPVNLVAEQELAELDAASAGNAAERDDLTQAIARLRGSIGTLNREGRQRLIAAFEAVNGHFRRLFTTLFDGGSAHLELIDSDDPLEAGLEIMAQPPGKRLQSLTLLSGGEQALTAVALIFGLFLTNPAPICVLDEVDAPLDDANIERFCDLLDAMSRDTATRYLVVTHNAVTMSRMHRLFGVTMIEKGVSRLVSVDLQAAETLLAAE